MAPTKWNLHLAEYRKNNPGVSLSQAMKNASTTYTKSENSKTKKTQTDEQKNRSKARKIIKTASAKLDSLGVEFSLSLSKTKLTHIN